jgi:catechol 2,3-dioxygenase-like lactoylglutathione lyase family enzyme
MTAHLRAISFDALDPELLGDFWAGFLGWERVEDARGDVAIASPDDAGYRLRFPRTEVPKTAQNLMHFDLTSATAAQQQETVERALALGARHLDIGQGPDAPNVVLADPEGNELDVLEAGNNFLANCGFLGALACDGSEAVGRFWNAALGWPLVWDQDQETAVQSPRGGTKVTWGGPPLEPHVGKGRVHLDLEAAGDLDTEVARLLSLGATRADIGQGAVAWAVLADPDGNEFCLTAPQRHPVQPRRRVTPCCPPATGSGCSGRPTWRRSRTWPPRTRSSTCSRSTAPA